MRKLTFHQAELIRALRKGDEKKYTHKVLATKFLVSKSTIQHILDNELYNAEVEHSTKVKLKRKLKRSIDFIISTTPVYSQKRGALIRGLAKAQNVDVRTVRRLAYGDASFTGFTKEIHCKCGKWFHQPRREQIYCSNACRYKYTKRRVKHD